MKRLRSMRLLPVGAIVAVILVGCGGEDTTEDDNAEDTGATATDETEEAEDTEPDTDSNDETEPEGDAQDPTQGDPVQLTFGHFVPATHLVHENVAQHLADELEDVTDGRITVDIHPGGALGPPDGQFENVQAGSFDIGFGLHFYTPGRFPLQTVMEFPFLFDSAEQATSAYFQLYEEFPELRAEMEGVKVLGLWTHDLGELMSRDDPIHEPSDLEGMRIRSPGPLQNTLIEALGGSPVTTPAPEIYDSVDRGVVDGVIGAYSLVTSFNLDETINHASKGGFYVATFFLVMNQETWDALTPEDQALLDSLTGEDISLRAARAYDEGYDLADARLREAGIEPYEFSSEELEVWRDAAEVVVEDWIAEQEAEGRPAREIYDRLLEIVE